MLKQYLVSQITSQKNYQWFACTGPHSKISGPFSTQVLIHEGLMSEVG